MVKSIPWGHNQRIMYKCKDINEAIFYVQKTMDNNYRQTGSYKSGRNGFLDLDLLFYHVRLHSYVVVELKTEKFKPEFAGKLNFYVTAVNKNMKTSEDMSQPIGIARYELTKVLRDEFKSSLPTIEEIESELSE